MSDRTIPQVAVVGAGYWGPNLVRNLMNYDPGSVRWVCDIEPDRLARLSETYPGIRTTQAYQEIIEDPAVAALMLALPPVFNHRVAMRALAAGKHLFVEKPMAMSLAEVREIVAKAEAMERLLMLGLTYRYHAMIDRIGQVIDEGRLGDLHRAYSRRTNLNQRPKAGSVIWMLAPHDLSIFRHWFGSQPQRVRACIRLVKQEVYEDEAFVDLQYTEPLKAHLYFSWLDPVKTRRIVVVGSEQVLVYDEITTPEQFTVHRNKWAGRDWPGNFGEMENLLAQLDPPTEVFRAGADFVEPLYKECAHFMECLKTGSRPLTDGNDASEITRVIQAIVRAGAEGGESVMVEMEEP